MAAVEVLETVELDEFSLAPYLRLLQAEPRPRVLAHGPSLAQRRAVRARLVQRRRRTLAGLVLVSALAILLVPGHVFGATTGSGPSGDLASSSVLASGMDYTVQPGDTVTSIAQDMNPTDPSSARELLQHELGSSVVVPGEHVLIP
jgi:hypothetical protein